MVKLSNILGLAIKTHKYVKPYMAHNILSMLLNQIASIFTLLSPLVLRFLIDDILALGQWNKLPIFIGLMCFLTISIQLMSLISNFIYAKFSETVYSDARNGLFSKIIKKSLVFFGNTNDGDFISRLMTDAGNMHVLLSYVFDKFLTNVIKVLIIFIILFTMNPLLGLITFFTVPLFLLLNKKVGKILLTNVREVRLWQNRLTDFYISTFHNIKMIKNFSTEEKEILSGRQINDKSKKIQIKTEIVGYFSSTVMGMITATNQLLVLCLGAYFVYIGTLSIGSLIAFNAYLAFVYSPFIEITRAYSELNRSIVGIERFFEYDNDEFEECFDKGVNIRDGLIPSIEIRNLDFTYCEKPVLNRLSLKISPGDKVFVTGRSGNGKSTIAALIKRFYKVDDGTILLNNIDINHLRLNDLRTKIFYLMQDNMFYQETVRDNFKRLKSNLSDDEIWTALKNAKIDGLLLESEHKGLDTVVNRNADNFSGGQRQRLSIARMFAVDSKIIILDEPLTGIDQENVKIIWENIKKFCEGKTLIVINHNIIEKGYFNHIVKLENGNVVKLD